MRFFIDTASRDEIRTAQDMGLVDGVTTNPSLMAREAAPWQEVAAEICSLVPGPVSLEVLALDTEGMVNEARDLVRFGPNVVIKVPMTADGLKAVRILHSMHIDTNVTLVFSATQALLAAKAGATYVSPFVGRLDDAGHNGMEIIHEIRTIFDTYAFSTQILAASIRSPLHVRDAALAGAHVATIPFAILTRLMRHPLTDVGIELFLRDWKARHGADT